MFDPTPNIEQTMSAPPPNTFDQEDEMSSPPLEVDRSLSPIEADRSLSPFDDTIIQSPGLDGIDGFDGLDGTLGSSPGPHRIYTPPPRLAERFYRPSQTRRKGSAASSRRNSTSSLQSLTLSSTNGPQSKHVANYQRRDAILKDRQQRLADRAAHVEKVRLRAAIQKERIISLSEDRALAAAVTRERKLMEIAATCAEEVKRAKAIAESTKGKRELEAQQARQRQQERQAAVERRREELRKHSSRARGSSLGTKKSVDSLPSVTEVKETETSPLSSETAVCRLQTWWRRTARSRAVNVFAQLGLTVDDVRNTPYDQVTDTLLEQRVIAATAHVLDICGLRHGPRESVNQLKAAKFFLSAFLILCHPTQVLSNAYNTNTQNPGPSSQRLARDDLDDPQVQQLVSRAKDLIITFETIMSRLASHNNYMLPPALATSLPDTFSLFESAFLRWQSRDKHALVDSMLKQLVELDALIETISGTSEPAVIAEYKKSVAPNQELLVVKVKRLLGKEQGSKAVRHAIAHGRKSRADRKKEQSQMKPRIAENTVTPESALADLGAAEQLSQPSTGTSATASPNAYPSPPSTPASRPSEPMPATSSKLLPENRVVVHELAIDKEYQVRASDFLEAETKALRPWLDQMRATMQADAVSREIHFYLLVKVAGFIRDKLSRLVSPPHPLCNHIAELLDVEQFKQQLETGSFSYETFFTAMGTLLSKMCAQFRDAELADLTENKLKRGSYVDRMESLILFIDCMVTDHANYLLSQVAPLLLNSAAAYETKAFALAIDQQKHGLFAAETAWRAARSKLVAETSRRDPENVNHPKNQPTAEKIYAHMLVGIFTQPSEMQHGQIPEMLRLDHKRIVKYNRLTRNIVTTCGILLQCKNLLKRDVRAPWKSEATRIETVLNTAESEETAVNGVMAALEAGRSIPPAMKSHLREFVQKLIVAHLLLASTAQPEPHGQWDPAAHDPTQPVLRLLLRRLRDHVTARMVAGSSGDKSKMASGAGEKLASCGLGEFADRVRDMVEEMSKVGFVDRGSHAEWWEKVASNVEAEAASARATTSS